MPVLGIRAPSGPIDLTHFPDFPSANASPRRGGALPDLIVLHYTAMTSSAEARLRLCDPEAEVSAHYLIDEHGQVDPLVPEELRAWHAGAGSWGRTVDVNSSSIGIELANDGNSPFSARQMDSLTDLLAGIRARWGIPRERVIAHSDMAPGRKRDPGCRFDWRCLALSGQAVWPETVPVEAGIAPDFETAARAFGYPDVGADMILSSFRLRFRPWSAGPPDDIDLALVRDLAARFPVDGPSQDA